MFSPNIEPLKMFVVGEIYVVLENYVNMDVELKLEISEVVVTRNLCLSRWLKEGALFNPITCKPEGIAQCIMFLTKEELLAPAII